MRHILILTLTFLYLFCIEIPAQTFNLLKDINSSPGNIGLRSTEFFQVNNQWFFVSFTIEEGSELWVTDGTTSGTRIVKDIVVGKSGSYPKLLTKVGNYIFFFAYGNTYSGNELWKSDGTAAGTTLVKDLGDAYNIQLRDEAIGFNNTFFFVFDDGIHGEELWKSDGTETGTVLVKDIVTGEGESYPTHLTIHNNELYFHVSGRFLQGIWKTDGTANGTQSVINQIGLNSSYYGPIRFSGGHLYYFVKENSLNNYSIWKYNLTTAQSSLIKIFPVNYFYGFPTLTTTVNNKVCFVIKDDDKTQTFWVSDGTANGTIPLKTFIANGTEDAIKNFMALNNTLFFSASTALHGHELWKTDGTVNGTQMIKDLFPGVASGNPDHFVITNNQLLFYTNNSGAGIALWKSDGTEAGTSIIKQNSATTNNNNPFYYSTTATNLLIFSSNTTDGQEEIWKSNGTVAGTSAIINLRPGTASSITSYFSELFNLSNILLLFTANNGASGDVLWKSDGTSTGTTLVKDFFPTPHVNNHINIYAEINGFAYMHVWNVFGRSELWKSNGTADGTQLVKSIPIETPIVKVNETLYFAGRSNEGLELWKSDGTETGTKLVKDINPQQYMSSNPFYLTKVGDNLFFTASDSAYSEFNLWKSDGTEAGTVRVKKIKQIQSDSITGFPSSSVYKQFVDINGTLYFVADDGIHGLELWKSDGSEAGTMMVKDIYKKTEYDPYSIFPHTLTKVNSTLFFVASDTTNGYSLWKSDGTEAGTVIVKEMFNPYTFYNISNLLDVNGTLFFHAIDTAHYREFWRSNGTSAGTYMIKDICPLLTVNSPGPGTNINGTLYFSTNDGISGEEIWKTDGTDAGTVMVQNIGLYGGADPWGFTLVGSKLYVVATTNQYGTELWVAETGLTTNINEEQLSRIYSAYPNPVINTVTLSTSIQQGNAYWTLLNTSGQFIKSGVIKAGEKTFAINMQDVARGMYFLKIQSERSKHTITKIIKQ